MEAGGIWAVVVLVLIILASLYLFFEVLGFTPSVPAGAGSAH